MLYKHKQLLENYTNSNLYGTYYHGSKTKDLKYLEPQLDKRLGITGVFISKDKYHPMAFSLIPNSYNASVNTTTKNGKFIKGTIISKDKLNDVGYLYTVTINKDNVNYLKSYKNDGYYLTNRIKIDKINTIKINNLINLGFKIKYKEY